MTVYEVLKFLGEPLERLTKAGIKTNDYKYIKLYEDYNKARKTGEKVGYVVAVLAERYQVSERTVYDVVRRFWAGLQKRFSVIHDKSLCKAQKRPNFAFTNGK